MTNSRSNTTQNKELDSIIAEMRGHTGEYVTQPFTVAMWADRLSALTAPSPASAGDGESLARQFHEAYERLAPQFGYETRAETRQFDPTTPNGKLMIAVCSALAVRDGAPRGEDLVKRLRQALIVMCDAADLMPDDVADLINEAALSLPKPAGESNENKN